MQIGQVIQMKGNLQLSTGYAFTLGSGVISFASKKQPW
jgi:hypothetical protein